jgi:hypothetical protein
MTYRQNVFRRDWFRNKLGVGLGLVFRIGLVSVLVQCTQVNMIACDVTLSVYPHRCGYTLRVTSQAIGLVLVKPLFSYVLSL